MSTSDLRKEFLYYTDLRKKLHLDDDGVLSDFKKKLLDSAGVLWVGPDDMAEVIESLESEAEKRDKVAPMLLGWIYYDGELVQKSETSAFKWWVFAAALDNPDAYIEVGKCFRYGTGIHKNLKEAAKFFLKAARQGDTEAQYILGIYAYTSGLAWEDAAGDGSELDPAIADFKFHDLWTDTEINEMLGMLWTAAEGGYAEAQFEVASFYETGRCGTFKVFGNMPKDFEKARKWYSLAADQGHKHAHTALLELGVIK